MSQSDLQISWKTLHPDVCQRQDFEAKYPKWILQGLINDRFSYFTFMVVSAGELII